MRKSWNVTRFLEGSRRTIRQRALRTLWADGHLIDYDLKQVLLSTLMGCGRAALV